MLEGIFKPAYQCNIQENQNPKHKHHGNLKSHKKFLFPFFFPPQAEDSDCQITEI